MGTKIQISPELLTLLGRKLYSGNPLWILCRELVQNSIDSSANKIELTVVHSNDHVTLEITDNGIGMSESDIHDYFLTIGSSHKTLIDSIGGFGLAKCAILSHREWRIHTNDNYLNSTILTNGEDIQKKAKRKGTKINVELDDQYSYGQFLSIMGNVAKMIEFTDRKNCEIRLNVHMDNSEFEIIPVGKSVKTYPVNSISVDNNDLVITKCDKFPSVTDHTYHVIRINGLPQIVDRLWNSRVNLITDINTTIDPSNEDYPFSVNRESLKYGIREKLSAIVQKFEENPLTNKITKKEEVQLKDESFEGEFLNPEEYNPALRSKGRPTKYHVVMEGYTSKKSAYEDKIKYAGLIRLWGELITLVKYANSDQVNTDKFTIGIVNAELNESTIAYNSNSSHYGFNSAYCYGYKRNQSEEEYLFEILLLACHEVTHDLEGNHCELFSSALHRIYNNSLKYVFADFEYLKRLVKKSLVI